MDRRKFLKVSSTALIASQLPVAQYISAAPIPGEMSTVYELVDVDQDKIRTLFDAFGGLETFIKTDPARTTVLIKPNICLPHSSGRGTVSSPALLELIVNELLSFGIKSIIVADHTLQKTEDFNNIELISVLEKYREVKLVFANEERMFQPIEVDGKVLKNTDVLRLLSRAGMFINVATAKHHQTTHVSLAIKNLMGTIWDRTVFHTSLEINRAIGDLAMAVKPTLNIIDASTVLLSGGPVGPGELINDNRIFVSTDICAVDATVVSRYNFGNRSLTAREVPHIRAAWENGVGEIEEDKIRMVKI